MLLKKATVLIVGLASLVLSPITASASVVHRPSCSTFLQISGWHYAVMSPTNQVLASVTLVYDQCDYVTYAEIDGAGRADINHLSVDLVYGDGANDSNARIVDHVDNNGNTAVLTLKTAAASLSAYPTKFFQARGYYSDGAGCSVYFDSNWHGYATGADTGGGWDGECTQY